MDGNEAVAYDDIEDDDIKDDDDDDTEDDDGDLLPSEFRLNQKSAEPGLFHICVGKQSIDIDIIIAHGWYLQFAGLSQDNFF